MIDANELRIGNIVNTHSDSNALGYPRHVILAQDIADLANGELEKRGISISPIPLTSEILVEWFGFEKTKDEKNPFENDSKYSMTPGRFEVFEKDNLTYNTIHGWWYFHRQVDWPIQSVHQLQNLFFALCGRELERKTK